jgi:hypothetical protein
MVPDLDLSLNNDIQEWNGAVLIKRNPSHLPGVPICWKSSFPPCPLDSLQTARTWSSSTTNSKAWSWASPNHFPSSNSSP